jgi:hypothetical protein
VVILVVYILTTGLSTTGLLLKKREDEVFTQWSPNSQQDGSGSQTKRERDSPRSRKEILEATNLFVAE